MRHCWRSTNDEVNQSFPFSEVSFLDLECHYKRLQSLLFLFLCHDSILDGARCSSTRRL